MSPKIIYIVTFALKMGATCAHGCHIYQVINHISTGLVYIWVNIHVSTWLYQKCDWQHLCQV